MGKDKRRNGRKLRKGERGKRAGRKTARRESWTVTGDGAGARDPGNPGRHRRRPVKPGTYPVPEVEENDDNDTEVGGDGLEG